MFYFFFNYKYCLHKCCGCGGIGRRAGFKIRFPLGSASSTLATRTIIQAYFNSKPIFTYFTKPGALFQLGEYEV